MSYETIVAVGAVCAALGAILGNSKLAVSIVTDVWEFIKRRPTRTKRLEVAVASISDTIGELRDDHRYVEGGMEALLNGMMVVLERTPGNGEVSEAKQRIRDFVSHRHAPC